MIWNLFLPTCARRTSRSRSFLFYINAQRRGNRLDGQATNRLLVQFTRPERYQSFVDRAMLRTIFGVDVPVASLADLVQGRLWAWSNAVK